MSDPIPTSSMKPVLLIDFAADVTRILPGVRMIANYGGRPGVLIGYQCQVEHVAEVAPSREYGEQLVTMLAEQVRTRAIRDLGLRPILDAQEREVQQYKESAQTMGALAKQRAERIEHLEAAIYRLENPHDCDDDDCEGNS